ncbi:MAG: four helix bundle protein [Bacteroidales bacterium]
MDLSVWKKAHSFVIDIYLVTKSFPKDELYGLTSQLRRAAVSIPANIAEGFGRLSSAEKIRFYNISQASLNEVKYYLILSNDLNYADTTGLVNRSDEIGKILDSYIKRIKENPM